MTPKNKILFRKHLHEGVLKACLKLGEARDRADADPGDANAQIQRAYWAGAYCALKGALEHFDEVS